MKEEKKCWIRLRYFVKRTGSICAKIVNEAGNEYTTCLHRNGAHSCDCKAGQRGVLCYHVMHLKNTQRKRAETAKKALVSKPTGNDTQSCVSGFSERKVEERAEEATPAIVERMMNAPLTGNRPFRLMR